MSAGLSGLQVREVKASIQAGNGALQLLKMQLRRFFLASRGKGKNLYYEREKI